MIAMGDFFKTNREIFDNPIWQDVVQFRLFFFLYGNARWKEEPMMKGNVEIGRGQILKSYRALQRDLEYIENRQVKQYPLSTLKRAVDRLVKNDRVSVLETELGTLFTINNYELYQGFHQVESGTWNATMNSDETVLEQQRNNKKKDNKEKEGERKDSSRSKKYIFEQIHMDLAEFFLEQIRANNPTFKEPNLKDWANTFRLMIERDNREAEKIKKCIEWVQAHDFWHKNILSADKLRKQYDRLSIQAADERKKFNVIKGGKRDHERLESSYEDDYENLNFEKRRM